MGRPGDYADRKLVELFHDNPPTAEETKLAELLCYNEIVRRIDSPSRATPRGNFRDMRAWVRRQFLADARWLIQEMGWDGASADR